MLSSTFIYENLLFGLAGGFIIFWFIFKLGCSYFLLLSVELEMESSCALLSKLFIVGLDYVESEFSSICLLFCIDVDSPAPFSKLMLYSFSEFVFEKLSWPLKSSGIEPIESLEGMGCKLSILKIGSSTEDFVRNFGFFLFINLTSSISNYLAELSKLSFSFIFPISNYFSFFSLSFFIFSYLLSNVMTGIDCIFFISILPFFFFCSSIVGLRFIKMPSIS